MFDNNWYKRVKQAVQDNIPVIVTIGTTVAAVAAAVHAKDSFDRNTELLKTIEEKIANAIEAPTIVKVEIGNDLELYGTGNRVD